MTSNENFTEQLIQCNTNTVSLFSLNGLYIGKVVEIYDGDSCKIVFPYNGILCKFNCRLLDIDTPEIAPSLNKINREEEIRAAIASRNRLIHLCSDFEITTLQTKKEIQELMNKNIKLITIVCDGYDKYGRLLIVLYDNENKKSFNTILLEEGFAKPYNGGTKL